MNKVDLDKVADDSSIRDIRPGDVERVHEIFTWYVHNTAVTFMHNPPSLEEYREHVAAIRRHYPFLVAEHKGKVVGFAYANRFGRGEAYNWSAELTIYIDPELRHAGLGRKLYDALEVILKDMGLLNLYACVGIPAEIEDEYLNYNSSQFHEHMGFKTVGTFARCGYKFNHFYSMIWMEKVIGEHRDGHAPERKGPPHHHI